MAREVAAKCTNLEGKSGEERHRHVQLVSGRAKACEVYPKELCKAIMRGLSRQLEKDGRMSRHGQGVTCQEGAELNDLEEHPHDDLPELVYDNVTGALLDREKVRKAREVEFDFVDRKHLYDEVPICEAYQVTGKRPTSTRFVDTDKGYTDG